MTSARTKARSYRRWSPAERRAIALESFGPDTTVTSVAKKHGVSAVSLYLWRKEFGPSPRPAGDAGQPDIGAHAPGLLPHSPAGLTDEDDNGDAAATVPGLVRKEQHRIRELEQQLARLQAELLASKRQRALLVSVLTSIGSQLKLLVEMEDSSYLSAPD